MLWSYLDEVFEMSSHHGLINPDRLEKVKWLRENENDVGLLVTDKDSTILLVNNVFSEVTGYEDAEIRGRNPRVLKSGTHGLDFYERLWTTLLRRGSWNGRIWDRRKDGSVYPEWLTITAIKDADGETVYYVATFIVSRGERRRPENWRMTPVRKH